MYELSVPHPERTHHQLFIVFLGGLYSVSQGSYANDPHEKLADFSDISILKVSGFWRTQYQIHVNDNPIAKLLCFMMIESEIKPEIVASNIKSSQPALIASLLLQMSDYRASEVLDRLSEELQEKKWLEVVTILVNNDLAKTSVYSNLIFSSRSPSLNLFLKLGHQEFAKLIPLLPQETLTSLVLNEYESVTEHEWNKVILLFELLANHRTGQRNAHVAEKVENLLKLICLENFDEEVVSDEMNLSKRSLLKLKLMKCDSQALKRHVAQSLTQMEQKVYLNSIPLKLLYEDCESCNLDNSVAWEVIVKRITEGEKVEHFLQNAGQNLKNYILNHYLDLYKQVTPSKQLEFLVYCLNYLLKNKAYSIDELHKSRLTEVLFEVESNAQDSSGYTHEEVEFLSSLMDSLKVGSKIRLIKRVDDLFGEKIASRLLFVLVKEKPEYFTSMTKFSPLLCKKLCMGLDREKQRLLENIFKTELFKLNGEGKRVFAICLSNISSIFRSDSGIKECITSELDNELSIEVVSDIWNQCHALFFVLYESSNDSNKTKLFELLGLNERKEFISDVGRYITCDFVEAIGKQSDRLIFLLGAAPNSAFIATEAINDHEFAELLIQMKPLIRQSLLMLFPTRRESIIQKEKEIRATLVNKKALETAKTPKIASAKGVKN
ncbi:hypothetical protein JQC92_11410 [Shewanella sp. 202IG2-18]|uniref:hypothetical protein n=1 Tax=Parashewanella hymeniacidonis TaxID=2807618 RepID=UPI00196081DF|nr:hypothetical protein [Parashewanella hymeniacidonis]MBM7072628.1 hypothetical protein [Parashewanella hymeniacidonis]